MFDFQVCKFAPELREQFFFFNYIVFFVGIILRNEYLKNILVNA